MAVDASIYNALLQPPKSVFDYQNQFAQQEQNKLGLQQNRLALALDQQKLDSYERGVREKNALASLLSDKSFDRKAPDAQARLYQTAPNLAPDVIKSWLDEDNTRADITKKTVDAKKAEVDTVGNSLKNYRAALDYVDTPEGAVRWLRAQYADPVVGQHLQGMGPLEAAISRIPTDPQGFQQWRMQAGMGMEKFQEHLLKTRQQNETERNNRAQNTVAQGQLAVAQGNLNQRKQEFGYQQAKDAQERKDKLSGADQSKITEGERKAATLLMRLRGSQKQLETVLSTSPSAAKPGLLSETLRNVPIVGGDTPANLVTDQNRQRVEAAQLDILDAALTLGTGAAYTKEQLRGYARSYFPQIGDDKATVEDKRVRLSNLIQAAEIAAGNAASRAVPAGTNTGGATGSWGDPAAAGDDPLGLRGR